MPPKQINWKIKVRHYFGTFGARPAVTKRTDIKTVYIYRPKNCYFPWRIVLAIVHCWRLNRTRVLVLKFPGENKKGRELLLCTCRVVLSFALLWLVAVRRRKRVVEHVLEYFRYSTHMEYDSKEVMLIIFGISLDCVCTFLPLNHWPSKLGKRPVLTYKWSK